MRSCNPETYLHDVLFSAVAWKYASTCKNQCARERENEGGSVPGLKSLAFPRGTYIVSK